MVSVLLISILRSGHGQSLMYNKHLVKGGA